MEVGQDQVLSGYRQQLGGGISARLVINSWEISDSKVMAVIINREKKMLKIK